MVTKIKLSAEEKLQVIRNKEKVFPRKLRIHKGFFNEIMHVIFLLWFFSVYKLGTVGASI